MPSFEETLSAGAKKRWVGGLSFVLMEVTGKVNITFYGRNNKVLEKVENVYEGVEGYWPDGFQSVEIEDVSGATNNIQLMISNLAQWKYSRFKGDVTVDGNIAGITAPVNVAGITDPVNVQPQDPLEFMADPYQVGEDRNFYACGASQNGASSNRSFVTVENPSGSGVTLLLRRFNVCHTTIWKCGFKSSIISGTGTNTGRRLNGNANANGIMRYGRNSSEQTPTYLMGEGSSASHPLLVDFGDVPIKLSEGDIFVVTHGATDKNIYAMAVWEER